MNMTGVSATCLLALQTLGAASDEPVKISLRESPYCPAFRLSCSGGHLTLFNSQSAAFPTTVAYSTAKGTAVRNRGRIAAADLCENWLLVWGFAPSADVPWLAVLQRKPVFIDPSGGVRLTFPHSAGAVALMRPSERPIDTKAWGRVAPASLVAQCRAFSRILLALPIRSERTVTLDFAKDEIRVKERFWFDSVEDQWRGAARACAPIPPALGFAAEQGFPATFDKPLANELRFEVPGGVWRYVPGEVAA